MNKQLGKKFRLFFEPTENIMSYYPTLQQAHNVLQGFYPNYFTNEGPNYNQIKQDIMTSRKAREAFKHAFPIAYQTTSLITEGTIEEISTQFGFQIIAHGVEESKGGMYNLLMMCMSGQINASCEHWGRFVEGMSNTSPLRHGPYYLIHSVNANNNTPLPDNPPVTELAYILVPFAENKGIITEQLEAMFRNNMVARESIDLFIDKTKTYDELLDILNQNQLNHCNPPAPAVPF